MERSSTWEVKPKEGGHEPGTYETLAWARDTETGQPVYILELDAKRTGVNCGCECPSCDLPLTAVNAGKIQYKRRPHFRHPAGAIKSECVFISARLAAMRLFQTEGFILLPKRTRTVTAVGISGTRYEGFYETPAKNFAIRDFSFSDKAVAILTLADGRKLQVDLIGKGVVNPGDGTPTACITLNTNDPAIAGMSLDELRANIELISDNLCWLSHWDDEEHAAKALADAEKKADDFMDLQRVYAAELEFIDKNLRHETVLHWEVKNILADAMALRVPKLEINLSKRASDGQLIEKSWVQDSHNIPLLSVRTEQRLGRLIPDVVADVSPEHGHTLLIEVTVTNTIDSDRINRIRNLNLPTLEIDTSFSGGLVSRNELREIVLNGLELKRWIHHPLRDEKYECLTSELESEITGIEQKLLKERQYRKKVLNTPLQEIVDEYLSLIIDIAEFDTLDSLSQSDLAKRDTLKEMLASVSQKLAIHDYPEATDETLTLGRQAIIPRVLSIKFGRGVGYKLNTTMDVMNAIKQSSNRNSSNHSIFMIAEKVYRPADAPPNPDWYGDWVNEVKRSINAHEQTYIRDRKFDRFLSLLFPEMSPGLAKNLKRKHSPDFDAEARIKANVEWWQAERKKRYQINSLPPHQARVIDPSNPYAELKGRSSPRKPPPGAADPTKK